MVTDYIEVDKRKTETIETDLEALKKVIYTIRTHFSGFRILLDKYTLAALKL